MRFCPTCGSIYDDPDLALCPKDKVALVEVSERAEQDPMLGKEVVGRFRIESLLGRGGFGAVYRARQLAIDRDVALKFVNRGASDLVVKRMMKEAKTVSRLRNVHTVTLFDVGVAEDGRLFMVMELIEGEELGARLARDGAMPWRDVLHIADQVLQSLQEAHGAGVVHRDLKSANILLTAMGEDPSYVKVLDFGMAKLTSETETGLTESGTSIGTPAYMSPEQTRGHQVDGRTDLYALGVICFELLTGGRPFSAEDTVRLLVKQCQDPPPFFAEVAPTLAIPRGVEAFVRALLAKRPENRPPDATDTRRRIVSLLESRGETDGTGEAEPTMARPAFTDADAVEATVPRRAAWKEAGTASSDDALATGLHRDPPPPAGTAHEPRRWHLGLVAAAAFAMVLGGLWAVTGVDTEPATVPIDGAPAAGSDLAPAPSSEVPPPAEPAAPAAPAQPPPSEVMAGAAEVKSVTVSTRPPGATVTDGTGASLGDTPLTLEVSEAARALTLRKRGYAPLSYTVRAGQTGEIELMLERKRRPRPAKRQGESWPDELIP